MVVTPPTLLGGLTVAGFLDRHWHKAPLLVRRALPGFVSPVTPDELAGYACADGVASQLFLEGEGDPPFEVRDGPFDPERLGELAPQGWSLLVHEMDRHCAEVAAILEHFRFIPNWRIDDIMISLAPAGGSVGAHADRYDVFLLQAAGRRRWRIGAALSPVRGATGDLDLRGDFQATEEWVLEPGDMLYLPPRVPHHGIALESCMTWSIGFRSPSVAEIVGACLGQLIGETLDPDRRYGDPWLTPQDHPGRIAPRALDEVRRIVRELVDDETSVARWFGRLVTEPVREERETPPASPLTGDEIVRALAGGSTLLRSAVSRFAFVEDPAGATTLFVGGEAYPLSPELDGAARLLSGTDRLDRHSLGPHLGRRPFVELVTLIANRGFLLLAEPDRVS